VVQKHAARRLHYDFRLELDGVLKSWAVPKGPSLVAGDKRLAAQTEDHPIEYADFEGVIPQGEYGAGAVVVWDQGTWEPVGDARRSLEKGALTFRLAGRKLRGRFHLVRLRARAGARERPKSDWLLFKGRDEEARSPDAPAVTDAEPRSVLSGRDLDDVSRDKDRVWSSPDGERAVERAPALRAEVAGVRLSNPDRVYFPELGVTKSELAQYYERMAERVLPGLVERPLSLVRCPEGRGSECFFQKRAERSIPASVPRVVVKKGRAAYAMVEDLADVVSLVQVGVLELHVWGARADDLERPDVLVVDLDPDPELPWSRVQEAALLLRELFRGVGLVPFVRSTGGKGLHVVVPLVRRSRWDEVQGFAMAAARRLEQVAPDRFTTHMAKAQRPGRIFLDVLRNAREATTIASWSTRARPGAPVAATLAWEEVERDDAPRVTLRDAADRLARPNPWAEFDASRRPLTAAAKRKIGAG
jgi:bifunctional non-homologous end joining protein LigD